MENQVLRLSGRVFGSQRGKAFVASEACRKRRQESEQQRSERDHEIGVEKGVELGAALKVMVQSINLRCDENLKVEIGPNTFHTSRVSSDGLCSSRFVEVELRWGHTMGSTTNGPKQRA